MTIPGVQKPHCRPWCSWKDRWSGWRSPPEASASIVVTSRPSACTASSVQDLTDSPSISTVHAPQLEVSHPTLVPMSPSRSRRKYTRRVRGSTSSSWVTSLTVIDTRLPPIRPPFRHRRPLQHDVREREAGVGCVEEGATERPRIYIGEVMRHQRQPPSGALSRPDNSPEPLRYTRPPKGGQTRRCGHRSNPTTVAPALPGGDPGEAAAPCPLPFSAPWERLGWNDGSMELDRVPKLVPLACLLVILVSPPVRGLVKGALLVPEVVPSPVHPLSGLLPRPQRREVRLPTGDADWYRPRGHAVAPGVVLVHGADPAGKDDARVVGLAEALAREGRQVLVPQLGLREQRFDAADPLRIRGAVSYLAGRSHGRVGVLAF